MSYAAAPPSKLTINDIGAYIPFGIFLTGWFILYGPVYFEYAQVEWQREENGHIPFIMAICVGTAWARITNPAFTFRAKVHEFYFGLALMVAGLGLFALGRVSEATLVVSFSQIVVAAAAAICVFGIAGAKALWFPLLLSFYLIIWPGWALNTLTAPLKQAISEVVSNSLYNLGLPVAHSGAVITAGQYQLLVADACAGLNSLISLSAVGAVYLYAVKRRSYKVNLVVLLSLVPIAIIANLVRVTMLVLLTYYFGYDAGQGFLHGVAGLLMFAIALASVFAVDAAVSRLWEPGRE